MKIVFKFKLYWYKSYWKFSIFFCYFSIFAFPLCFRNKYADRCVWTLLDMIYEMSKLDSCLVVQFVFLLYSINQRLLSFISELLVARSVLQTAKSRESKVRGLFSSFFCPTGMIPWSCRMCYLWKGRIVIFRGGGGEGEVNEVRIC